MQTPYASGVSAEWAPLSEILENAARIDGLDIELALSRISGKQAVLEACIEQTVCSMDEKLRTMSVCLSKGELRLFSIEAHGLKNALAGIGATRHSELASELEAASKSGDAAGCKKGFVVFASQMKALTSELRGAFPKVSAGERPCGDRGMLLQVAGQASDCLSLFETDDALSCIARLDGFTFGEETDALIGHIKSKVKSYKYDEAIIMLRSILAN